MKESERVTLYNDLSDYEQDLRGIIYPSQAKAIDIVHRATLFVRGVNARWVYTSNSEERNDSSSQKSYIDNCTCSSCGFTRGCSDFKICPSCGAHMLKNF